MRKHVIAHDYRYLRQGKYIRPLTQEETYLLEPYYQETAGHHKRALLLLHGFASSPAVYRYLIPKLPPYDAIHCPVLPGHGRDLQAFSKVNVLAWSQSVLEAYRLLASRYEHIDVLGLSLGGLLAHQLSLQVPLHHLYLLAPAFAIHASIPRLLWLARLLQILHINKIPNRGGDIYTSLHAEITYKSLPLTSITTMLTCIKDTPFVQPSCPTDLFLGAHDTVVDSDQVAKQFTPNHTQRLHWLKNSAHILPLDRDLDDIIHVIKQNWCQSMSQDSLS